MKVRIQVLLASSVISAILLAQSSPLTQVESDRAAKTVTEAAEKLKVNVNAKKFTLKLDSAKKQIEVTDGSILAFVDRQGQLQGFRLEAKAEARTKQTFGDKRVTESKVKSEAKRLAELLWGKNEASEGKVTLLDNSYAKNSYRFSLTRKLSNGNTRYYMFLFAAEDGSILSLRQGQSSPRIR